MSIEIALKGFEAFKASLDKMVEHADTGAAKAVTQAAELVAEKAAGRIHSRSGKLAASLKPAKPTRVGFGDYELKVGPKGVVYARKHDLGKHGRHSGPPHPSFQPGYHEASSEFAEIFRRAWTQL